MNKSHFAACTVLSGRRQRWAAGFEKNMNLIAHRLADILLYRGTEIAAPLSRELHPSTAVTSTANAMPRLSMFTLDRSWSPGRLCLWCPCRGLLGTLSSGK